MSITPLQYNSVFFLGSNSDATRVARNYLSHGSGYSMFDSGVISGLQDAVRVLIARGELGMHKEYLKYTWVDSRKRHLVVDTEVGHLYVGLWKSSKINENYRKIKLIWDRRLQRVLRVLNDPLARPLFVWIGTGYDRQDVLDQYYPQRLHRHYGYDLELAQETTAVLHRNFPAQSSLLYIDYDANMPIPELRYIDSTLIACSHGYVTPESNTDIEAFYDRILQEFKPIFSEFLHPTKDKDVYTRTLHCAEKNSCILRVKDVDWEDYVIVDLGLKEAYRETVPEVKYQVRTYVANKFIELVPVDGFCSWFRYHFSREKKIWQRTYKRAAQLFPDNPSIAALTSKPQEPAQVAPQFWEQADHLCVTSLWVGKALPLWAQLSIKSWLDNGHKYRLFIYEPCTNIPEGVDVWDAWNVLPESAIFSEYSYHNFSQWWRWAWLAKEGGIWVDIDMICLKEHLPINRAVPVLPWGCESDCIMSFPPGHIVPALMAHLGEDPMWITPWDSETTVLRKQRAVATSSDIAKRRAVAPYGYAKLQCQLGGISKMPYEYQYWGLKNCLGVYWRTPAVFYTEPKALEEIVSFDDFALHLRGTWADAKGVTQQPVPGSIYAELLRRHNLPVPGK